MKRFIYILILLPTLLQAQTMDFAFKGSAAITRQKLPVAVCYSVRRIVDKYSGMCLQVRRSSDNATQDIGFTPNGDLDTAALKTFVGSNTGYVTIWYDQSGNGRNATQATTTAQPTIVVSGVVQRSKLKPAIIFNGSSQTMASSAFGLINQPVTRNSVISVLNNTGSLHYINSVGGNPNTGLVTFSSGYISIYAGGSIISTVFSYIVNKQYIYTELYNGSTSQLIQNGTSSGNVNVGTTGINGVQIASYDGASYYSNIAVSEITLFPQLLSTTDRQAIESNQNRYYKAY